MSDVPTNGEQERWKAMAVRAVVCLGAGLVGWWWHDRNHSVSTACFMVAYLFGAWDLARQTWADLRQIRFDTHFLMMLVVPGAVAIGAWGEGAVLLFLFSASTAMEEFALGRTRREINALLRAAPKQARRVVDGREQVVEVADLRPGEILRVTAGDQVPVDFVVTTGQSSCDESSLTGESEPVTKGPGDTAFAGTVNQWGLLEGRVLKAADDSALQRIIRLIQHAQQQKAPTQRFSDRFGSGYTAAVLAACLGVFLYWWQGRGLPPLFAGEGQASAFYRAMTLMVVLSPCALVLSVPSAILSAIACGARRGVLFRGGAAIENLARVTAVAMDKTGTLTEGNLNVVGLEVRLGLEPEAQAAALALAHGSSHPVSRSVSRELARRGVGLEPVTDLATIPGRGLEATWRGGRIALGNRELIAARLGEAIRAGLPPPVENTTETWVAGDGLLARFLLRDTLRPETEALVARLHRDGLKTVMLTGDRAAAAETIGRRAGVQVIISQLKPEDKLTEVQRLKAAGEFVAMIGDGVNDAPVLAAADVGVAMGARGSDAAIEQADVVLMLDRLENFLFALELSRRARSVIRQNLVLALGTMGVMAGVTLGWPGLPLAAGVGAHEGSTALVVLNSLRLLWHREGGDPRRAPDHSSPS